MDETGADTVPSAGVDPNIIRVRSRRPPWLWVAAVVVLALLGLLGYSLATNGAYAWPTYRRHILDREFGRAALVTLELTGIATAIALVLGALLAGMRTSANVVLRSVAWTYGWLFRSTPVYLQLVLWGLFGQLYPHLGLAVPGGASLTSTSSARVVTAFVAACLGLGLNATAYQADVFRSGFAAVAVAQREAGLLLGMSPRVLRQRVIWPGAARFIVPATIDRIITTVKVSALVVAVPLASDLYGRSVRTAALVDRAVPLLLCALTYYLLIVSGLTFLRWLTERLLSRTPRQPDRQIVEADA